MSVKAVAPPALLGSCILVAWELTCRLFDVPGYLLPAPSVIARELVENLLMLGRNTAVTMIEAVGGFLVANTLAVLLAVAMVYIRHLDRALLPFAIALKTTPIVAMAPLLILWFGTGIAPKVAAAAVICFFPALVNSMRGFDALLEGEEDLFKVYGASKTKILVKLRFQRAAPYILSALKISSSLAIVGAIVGEFVGANEGIGYVMLVASYHLNTPRMFAALASAAAAGVAFYGVISIMDRKLVFWMDAPTDEIRLDSPRRGRQTVA